MDTSSLFDGVMAAKLGGGVIAGIAVGYALKKATKIALFVLGLIILVLYGLMKAELITVQWDAVSAQLEHGSRSFGSFLAGLVKDLSASLIGFAGGFFLGVKLR